MISSEYADQQSLTLTEAIALGAALPEKYLLVDNKTDLGSNLTVAQEEAKAAEAQKIIDGAINKVGQLDATYSLLDTLDNIAGAKPEVVDGATAYKLLDGVLTIEGPQTVALAQAEIARGQALVDGSANAAGTIYKPVYELADTLANLEKAPALVEGAVDYALTNEPGNLGPLTPEQIAIVEGATDAGEYTWDIAPSEARLTPQTDIKTASLFDGAEQENALGGFNATLNSSDVLTGQGDDARLVVISENTAAALAASPTMTNVKTLDISNYNVAGAAVIGGSKISGLTDINNIGSSNGVTVGTAASALQTKVDAVSLSNVSAATVVTVANAALVGAADSAELVLNGTARGSSFAINAASGGNGYETINVASVDAASTIDNILVGNTARTAYTFAGDQNVTVEGAAGAVNPLSASVTSIDASEMTGNLTLGRVVAGANTAAAAIVENGIATNAVGAGAVSITGGDGNDSVFITDLSNRYKINGGDSVDRVTVLGNAGVATSPTITNVEEMRFTDTAVVGGFSALGLGAAAVNANLVGVTGLNTFLLDGARAVFSQRGS